MRLTELLGGEKTIMLSGAQLNPEIRGLSADSRKIGPGYLFAALPGSQHDGRDYIDQAVAQGAAAILTTSGSRLKGYGRPISLLTSENPRRDLARLAAAFHGRQPRSIAAVTGTNGKTSVADFVRQIWQALGVPAASLGTLGAIPARADAPAGLTTPDPAELHRYLAALAEDGIDHLVMEASSHGLDQYRLDGVQLSVAAFTNLTRDHLDYHGSWEAYFEAKCRLFTELLAPQGVAVLDIRSEAGRKLRDRCRERGLAVLECGNGDAEIGLLDQQATAGGQRIRIILQGREHRLEVPLAGQFQAFNIQIAIGTLLAFGVAPERIIETLPRLRGAPGRIEWIGRTSRGGAVFVDYAHSPDALESVLSALRPHTEQRLFVVFGCGGDRDSGKRPQMGEIAGRLADVVIVTDDNPRGEDPAAIRRAILAAVPGAREIGDRGEAIAEAMATLGPGDTLVIAGKGHESGQIVGEAILPFDDRNVARALVTLPAGGST